MAQCSPQYARLLAEGDRLATATPPQYEAAVKKYNAALLLCPEKSSEAQGKIIAVFNQIEALRKEAEEIEKQAQAQLAQIRERQRRQLATYRTNLQNALGRYEIVEARGELDKMRQTQLASAQELTALERQIADTVESLKPDMVWVEGGTFWMGYQEDRDGVDIYMDASKPLHEVSLDGYYIGKTEVTQALWQKVMGNNPSYYKPPSFAACPDCPVESVSWNDAQEFIRRLNEKTGMDYRLPTEAEWEYAARGGNQSRGYLYAGGNDLDEMGWYGDYKTHPVGQKDPNELGIYDMSGNVWEWCADRYSSYPEGPVTDPKGPEEGYARVGRGGSWVSVAVNCRVAGRSRLTPAGSGYDLGLRLARNE